MFNSDMEKARKLFVEYNNEQKYDICMDIVEESRITDKEAIKIVKEVFKVEEYPKYKSLTY
ncbi:MAG: hypothetical protein ACOX8P_09880 [Tepidanaerobacteraceae bacterium]|jgi:hypothetical protein